MCGLWETSLTHLLFSGADVPPVQPEDVQQAPSVQHLVLPWLVSGQGCEPNLYSSRLHSSLPCVYVEDSAENAPMHGLIN